MTQQQQPIQYASSGIGSYPDGRLVHKFPDKVVQNPDLPRYEDFGDPPPILMVDLCGRHDVADPAARAWLRDKKVRPEEKQVPCWICPRCWLSSKDVWVALLGCLLVSLVSTAMGAAAGLDKHWVGVLTIWAWFGIPWAMLAVASMLWRRKEALVENVRNRWIYEEIAPSPKYRAALMELGA